MSMKRVVPHYFDTDLFRRRYCALRTVHRVLDAWDFVCYVALDVAVGRLLATVVLQLVVAKLQAHELYV